MHSDRLYELGFWFRSEKPWTILDETDIFALKLSNGKSAYCLVMGGCSGSHLALAVYVGSKAFQSYYRVVNNPMQGDDIYQLLSQDCLQCSVEPDPEQIHRDEMRLLKAYAKEHGLKFSKKANPYVNFESFKPEFVPWIINEKEESVLIEALEALQDVMSRLQNHALQDLGFSYDAKMNRECPLLEKTDAGYVWSMTKLPKETPMRYPQPKELDQFTATDIRKKRKSGTIMARVFFLSQPVPIKFGQAPRLPSGLLVADDQTGNAYPLMPEESYTDKPDVYLREFVAWMNENRRYPKTVYVDDDRTETFFRQICQDCCIELVREDRMEEMDELFEDLLVDIERQTGYPSGSPASDIISFINSMSDEDIFLLPADIKGMILFMMDNGMLPPSVSGRLRTLLKK